MTRKKANTAPPGREADEKASGIKRKHGWFRWFMFRRMVVILIIVLQVAFFAYFLKADTLVSRILSAVVSVVSIFLAIYLVNKNMKPAYRIIWLVIILAFPVLGPFYYLLLHLLPNKHWVMKRYAAIARESQPAFRTPNELSPGERNGLFHRWSRSASYLSDFAGFPAYAHTRNEYLSPGEAFFPRFLEDLEKAEKYIYMEYFIVEEGVMTEKVLNVLERKVKEGVDVRFMYDDIGSLMTLPKNYVEILRRRGIRAAVFNRFIPVFTSIQNNRDHRKITVIDGRIAYTGGLNIADEYINVYEKHGYWKDGVIRVEGDAAWSFTVIFLQLWSLAAGEHFTLPQKPPEFSPEERPETDGAVLPYADSPLDTETVGEYVYTQLIAGANRTLYATTPYFMVDDGLLSGLKLAAKSGVDVRLITPRVWDKFFVHVITRSYYRELIEAGIRVYEYTPGFMHAKVMVADDEIATVGTVNLDFRSLYLHFEDGVLVCGSSAVGEIRKDFLRALEDSSEITLEDVKSNLFMRLMGNLMRLFAPLL
ncbi:MAG: cardiolipin synthase [Clostridia bacterium]|nr:cardiolipin synthase [Clostridia bacterium]